MVTLIKEKRNGNIKGRACANGSKQRYTMNEDLNVSSPTVSMDALFTTLLVAANNNQDVATFGVPRAFLQPEMPKRDGKLLLKLKGIFVDIMCEVNPEYICTVNYKK